MDTRLQDARWLWERCFPDDDASFLDFYFSKVAKPQDTYVDYDNSGKPIAHIGVLRYGYNHQTQQKLAYISGACTLPEARRNGLMKCLMNRVIHEEKQRGSDALILIPASEELRQYYNKHFGFVDTATFLRLNLSEYMEYLHKVTVEPVLSTDIYEVLRDTTLRAQHITYSQEQVEAIIEEYERFPIGIVRSVSSPKGISAMLLARQTPTQLYVDYLVGDRDTRIKLLNDLQADYPTLPIEILYTFVNGEVSPPTSVAQLGIRQVWGMALPLNTESTTFPWSSLGISLVHN